MAPSAFVPVAILRLGSVCQPLRGVQHSTEFPAGGNILPNGWVLFDGGSFYPF